MAQALDRHSGANVRLLIAYHRHGWDRGIERKSAELAERFARNGHAVEYLCATAEPRSGSAVRIARVPIRGGPTSLMLGTFDYFARRALRRRPHDLSLSFGSVVGCDILTAESCHRAGLEVISRMREHTGGEARNLGLADAIRLRIERRNYADRRYLCVVACSRRVQRELGGHYDVPASDVTVIPSGVDAQEFSPERTGRERTDFRSSLGYGPDHTVLLFVGNEFARKGLKTLIQALGLLRDRSLRLLVCGDGSPETYMRLARELGVADRIRFEGHVKGVARYFSASDIFVFPTLHEAFGLVILEAMASGLPVIVSKAAGAAEDHLRDGREGMLLDDPTDAARLARNIRSVIERPDRGRAFGEAGRMRASELTWEVCAAAWLALLSEALEAKRSRRMTMQGG